MKSSQSWSWLYTPTKISRSAWWNKQEHQQQLTCLCAQWHFGVVASSQDPRMFWQQLKDWQQLKERDYTNNSHVIYLQDIFQKLWMIACTLVVFFKNDLYATSLHWWTCQWVRHHHETFQLTYAPNSLEWCNVVKKKLMCKYRILFNCKARSKGKLTRKCFMVRMKEHSWIQLLNKIWKQIIKV